MEMYALKAERVKAGDDLASIISLMLKTGNLQFEEGDVLTLASKIVSYSQKRLAIMAPQQPMGCRSFASTSQSRSADDADNSRFGVTGC